MSFLRTLDPNWLMAIAGALVASVMRQWFILRKTEVKERSESDRFAKAVEGSTPAERPEIILAYRLARGQPEHHEKVLPGKQTDSLFRWFKQL